MPSRNTTIRDRHRQHIAKTKPDCGICGNPIDYQLPHLDPGEYVVDHILPRHRGGADTLENKQAAHRSCNGEKSSTIPQGMEAPPRTFITTLTW